MDDGAPTRGNIDLGRLEPMLADYQLVRRRRVRHGRTGRRQNAADDKHEKRPAPHWALAFRVGMQAICAIGRASGARAHGSVPFK